MIYKSRAAAIASLTDFSPALRARHKVIRATIEGAPVGWMRVFA